MLEEETEIQLEAMMRQRRLNEARLNRALGELLGSGRGAPEALAAIAELEDVLRAIATLVGSLEG